eukprot:g6163.t1
MRLLHSQTKEKERALGLEPGSLSINFDTLWLPEPDFREVSSGLRDLGTGTGDEDRLFDVVIMQLLLSVVGGAAQRASALQNAARFLRPGGMLLLSASGDSAAVNADYAAAYRRDEPATGEPRTYYSRDACGSVLYETHHFTRKELLAGLRATPGLDAAKIHVHSELEASSRRPDQAAVFLYARAEKGAVDTARRQ